MTRLITSIVVIVATAALVVYDIVIVIEPTPGDTISAVLLNWAHRYPVVSWLWGGLAGHLFWPMKTLQGNALPIPFTATTVNSVVYMWWALGALIAATVTLGVLSFTGILGGMNPVIFLVAGIPAGHWGWPQYREHRR